MKDTHTVISQVQLKHNSSQFSVTLENRIKTTISGIIKMQNTNFSFKFSNMFVYQYCEADIVLEMNQKYSIY